MGGMTLIVIFTLTHFHFESLYRLPILNAISSENER